MRISCLMPCASYLALYILSQPERKEKEVEKKKQNPNRLFAHHTHHKSATPTKTSRSAIGEEESFAKASGGWRELAALVDTVARVVVAAVLLVVVTGGELEAVDDDDNVEEPASAPADVVDVVDAPEADEAPELDTDDVEIDVEVGGVEDEDGGGVDVLVGVALGVVVDVGGACEDVLEVGVILALVVGGGIMAALVAVLAEA